MVLRAGTLKIFAARLENHLGTGTAVIYLEISQLNTLLLYEGKLLGMVFKFKIYYIIKIKHLGFPTRSSIYIIAED